MEARSNYLSAVLEEGSYVLGQVVKHLYKGGNLRPDLYFSDDITMARKNYKTIFNPQQRSLIESSGSQDSYNIENAVPYFDVTLLALLAEHTCGLSHRDNLLVKVRELRTIRNKVGHTGAFEIEPYVSDSNICEKLQELLDLFNEILDEIDHRIFGNVQHVKLEVHRRIEQRMPRSSRLVQYPSPEPTLSGFMSSISSASSGIPTSPEHNQFVSRSSKSSTSSGIPTWGKVAIGATVAMGIAGLVGGLLNSSEKDKKQKRREM